jgi:hypothetical protein
LSLNSSIGGNMSSSDDNDYYKLTPTSNGEINLTFNHLYVDNDSVYWYIKVYLYSDGTYTELSSTTVNGTDNEKISLPMIGAVASKTYYVNISTRWDVTVGKEYTLTTDFNSTEYAEKENNESYYTATNCQLNKSYTGCMGSSSDEDFYKIIAQNNGCIKLNFNHQYVDNDSVYWYVSIFNYADGEYNELSSVTINGKDNESVELPMIGAVASGVYYVKVTTRWDVTIGRNYILTNTFKSSDYYEKELNDTYYTATACQIDKTYVGCMNSENDSDYYKITPTKSGKLKLKFTHSFVDNDSVYWYVTIYSYSSGEYTELVSQTVNGKDEENVELPSIGVTASGTYYVKVSTRWGETVGREYKIFINQPKSLSSAKVSSISAQVFKDKNLTPNVTVKYGGTTLKKGTDYVLSYSDNYSVGTATVTITGKGSYTGTITKKFKIIPKSVKLKSLKNKKGKSLEVKWSVNRNASGYQIVYSTNKSFKKAKSVDFSWNLYKNTTIYNLKKNKTYYVKIRAYNWSDGKRIYSSYSSVLSKKIKK